MREFFRGWRRKVGCVALVMACVCMSGWLRSLYIYDSFSTFSDSHYFTCSSGFGRLGFAIDELEFKGTGSLLGRQVGWISDSYPERHDDHFADRGLHVEMDSKWHEIGLFGFEIHQFQTDSSDYKRKLRGILLRVSYLGIEVPLTLLSAYLILWKPRPKPKGEPNA